MSTFLNHRKILSLLIFKPHLINVAVTSSCMYIFIPGVHTLLGLPQGQGGDWGKGLRLCKDCSHFIFF